jgi:MinD superfamily P-loop ATPase
MKELVVISGKGGTGKTSLTGAFATLEKRIIVADCDVDAADLHLILDPTIRRREKFQGGHKAKIDKKRCIDCDRCRELCRFGAITADYRVEEISCEGCGVCVWNCPVDAISFPHKVDGEWYLSDIRTGSMVHAKLDIAAENSGKLVTLVRKEARRLAEENRLDLILVDGPPGTGCPVIASIGGASMTLVVTEPTVSAIQDMQRVLQLAEHFHVPAAVCINKYDLNQSLTETIEAYCQRQKIEILGSLPFDTAVTRAQVAGMSIVDFTDGPLKDTFISLWSNVRNRLYQQ